MAYYVRKVKLNGQIWTFNRILLGRRSPQLRIGTAHVPTMIHRYGGKAALGLDDMCASMWRFERMLATSNVAKSD